MLHIGCVSYLNTKPLIYGLDRYPDLRLHLDVPSRLLEGLRDRRFDVALLPVIDYQRLEGLTALRAGGIGSEGTTLTVRIFSRVPIGQIARIACDTDSHTSVALVRVILNKSYGLSPVVADLKGNDVAGNDAILLIGDKVICEEPAGYPHQLDLGEAWRTLTGLPFVFAIWQAREGVPLEELSKRLARAREEGLAHVDEIVKEHAIPRGWPAETARKYLQENLHYEIREPQLEAIRLFHRYAAELGIVKLPARELVVY